MMDHGCPAGPVVVVCGCRSWWVFMIGWRLSGRAIWRGAQPRQGPASDGPSGPRGERSPQRRSPPPVTRHQVRSWSVSAARRVDRLPLNGVEGTEAVDHLGPHVRSTGVRTTPRRGGGWSSKLHGPGDRRVGGHDDLVSLGAVGGHPRVELHVRLDAATPGVVLHPVDLDSGEPVTATTSFRHVSRSGRWGMNSSTANVAAFLEVSARRCRRRSDLWPTR